MHIDAGPWQSGVTSAWSDLGNLLPRLAFAAGVLVAGWILAVVLGKVADLVMEHAATRQDTGARVVTVAVRARRAVPRLVHLAVVLVACWTAVEVVDPGSGATPAADFVSALRGLFALLGTALVLTVAGILVVGVGGGMVRPMERRWEGWLTRLERTSEREPEAEREPQRQPTDRPERESGLVSEEPVAPGGQATGDEADTREQPHMSGGSPGTDTDSTQVLPAASGRSGGR